MEGTDGGTVGVDPLRAGGFRAVEAGLRRELGRAGRSIRRGPGVPLPQSQAAGLPHRVETFSYHLVDTQIKIRSDSKAKSTARATTPLLLKEGRNGAPSLANHFAAGDPRPRITSWGCFPGGGLRCWSPG